MENYNPSPTSPDEGQIATKKRKKDDISVSPDAFSDIMTNTKMSFGDRTNNSFLKYANDNVALEQKVAAAVERQLQIQKKRKAITAYCYNTRYCDYRFNIYTLKF